MTTERLSKFQKWVLQRCYETADEEEKYVISKTELFRFFNWKHEFYRYCEDCGGPCKDGSGKFSWPVHRKAKRYIGSAAYNRANAMMSRSLKNLRQKGYVKLFSHASKTSRNKFVMGMSVATGMSGKELPENGKERFAYLENLERGFNEIWEKTRGEGYFEIKREPKVGFELKTKALQLTAKGKAEAKELLKVNFSKEGKVNTKELPRETVPMESTASDSL